jgi:hypothetical protein
VRVGGHLQRLRPPRPQNLRDAADQRRSDPRRLQPGSTNRSSSSAMPPASAQVAEPTSEPCSSATYVRPSASPPGTQDQVFGMGQQAVTVPRIGQARPAIGTGCGRVVRGHATPDHRPSICQAGPSHSARHQHVAARPGPASPYSEADACDTAAEGTGLAHDQVRDRSGRRHSPGP